VTDPYVTTLTTIRATPIHDAVEAYAGDNVRAIRR
jgi:hypothetical protein